MAEWILTIVLGVPVVAFLLAAIFWQHQDNMNR